MPAFDATVETDLKEVLKNMGIKDAFEDWANFSEITDEKIRVSKAKTKTVVKVDEEGSEAAAVAAAIMFEPTSQLVLPPPIDFIVDRPFAFKIHDSKFDIPLFVGIVVNPN